MAKKWQYQQWYDMNKYNAGKICVKANYYFNQSQIRQMFGTYKEKIIDSKLARGLMKTQYSKDFFREMYVNADKERIERLEKYFNNILFYYLQLTMTRVIKDNCRILCFNVDNFLKSGITAENGDMVISTVELLKRIEKHDQWMAKQVEV